MTMVIGGNDAEVHTSGESQTEATPGGHVCVECGYALSLLADDRVPHCPACGGSQLPPDRDVRADRPGR